MAKDEKGSEAAPRPVVTAGGEGLDYVVRLTEMQRIEADPEDDDLGDLFAVTIAMDGPNAEGSVEVMVTDAADVEVVALALDTLHGALLAWADLIQRRKAEMRAILVEG